MVFHLAALLSTRAEFIPETAHAVNVQGTLKSPGACGGGGAQSRAPDPVPLPQLDRRLRLARPRDQAGGRPGRRGRVAERLHDVRLHEARVRAPRALLRAPLPPARRVAGRERRRFPGHPLPGADLGLHGPLCRRLPGWPASESGTLCNGDGSKDRATAAGGRSHVTYPLSATRGSDLCEPTDATQRTRHG